MATDGSTRRSESEIGGEILGLNHEKNRGTVPYVWPYLVGYSLNLGLKNRPKIYGRYLQFRILKFPLIWEY